MDFLNTPEKRDRRLVHLPMGRFGEAIEIAKAALFRKCNFPTFSTLLSLTFSFQSGVWREQLHNGVLIPYFTLFLSDYLNSYREPTSP